MELIIMFKIIELRSLSAVVMLSAFILVPVSANDNPFNATDKTSSYLVADSHGGKHCKMKKMDTDGDGSVSKDEFMAHAEKKFSYKDKNGDGVLSADEMKRRKHHGEKKSDG